MKCRGWACSSLTHSLIRACHSLFQSSKENTLSKFIKNLGNFLHVHQNSFIYLFSNVWLKPSEIGKVQSSRTLPISLEVWGAFHSTKTSGLNFRQFLVANRAALSKISIKEDNLAWYIQIFKKISWNFSLHSKALFPEFQEASAELFRHFGNSTVPRISGNFYGKFLYHLPLFLESYGWMEIKRPWCTRSVQDPRGIV